MKRIFIEAKDFQKIIESLKDRDLLLTIQNEILKDPKIGDIVRGAGGVRKFRVAAKGKGKSGGIRVFYLDIPEKGKCYLLFVLQKSDSDNITDEEKNEIQKLAQALKK